MCCEILVDSGCGVFGFFGCFDVVYFVVYIKCFCWCVVCFFDDFVENVSFVE